MRNHTPSFSKLSIVMPVYNELATLEEIVQRVLAVPLPLTKELVLVDDCSKDGTRELYPKIKAAYPDVPITIAMHEHNQGKGAALRTGFAAATGDIVLIQDADLEYDPRDYPRLLEPILDGRADVVYGSRFVGSDAHRVLYYWHYAGNRFLTLFSNMLTNLNLTDMETCYKVFRREVLQNIRLRSDRFAFEPEITAKVARGRWRIYEVGISYSGRSYDEGKKITWWDGIKAIGAILWFRISR
ncbi:MAG: Undecaprenyl-phosphate 4-deoxy-4-formamido-L-arabinose transferase [Phycisphaerae bacterium]|nr:Undecaprenyl-phosphate 4-deoxy-4-formamido-L-arabinose transferase [Phycisphaerae bacterium]